MPMMVVGSALAGAGLIATAVASGRADAEEGTSFRSARAVVVVMRGFAFAPTRVSASVGDSIVWINRDALPHTASAHSGAWDSGELRTGARWSWVPADTGTVDYICAYHPSMRGTIHVR